MPETAPNSPETTPEAASVPPPEPAKPEQAAAVSADAVKELVDAAKKTLEYQIAQRDALITVAQKRMVLRKWGLRNHMALGGKVVSMLQRLQAVLPNGIEQIDAGLIAQVMSVLADDIIDIIVRSTVNTFKTHAEGVEWMDQNCSLDDVFEVALIVYDQNYGDEDVGKVQAGLAGIGEKIRLLSSRSSKS